jgi:hypothetical protein
MIEESTVTRKVRFVMKVFISHKKEDEDIAKRIHLLLGLRDVPAYLDLLDPSIVADGRALTDHIKSELNDCTDIMVIMSSSTRLSQWVYFEVGMSAQIDMPTVTYLQEDVVLPSFLQYWPRLRKLSDVNEYVAARQATANRMDELYGLTESASRRRTEAHMFYRQLKSQLGQLS